MLRILFIALARTDPNIKRKPKLAVSVLKFAPLLRKMKTTPATDKIKKSFCSKPVFSLRKTDAKRRVKIGTSACKIPASEDDIYCKAKDWKVKKRTGIAQSNLSK